MPSNVVVCAVKDCPMFAKYLPQIVVWAPNYKGQPCLVQLGLPHCELHKRTESLIAIMDDTGWEMICDLIRSAGRVEPDRRLTSLEWVLIENFPNIDLSKFHA